MFRLEPCGFFVNSIFIVSVTSNYVTTKTDLYQYHQCPKMSSMSILILVLEKCEPFVHHINHLTTVLRQFFRFLRLAREST